MKKISMIMFNYPLWISPLLIYSAILLAKEGYDIHIFLDKPQFKRTRVDFRGSSISVHEIEVDTSYNSGIWSKNITVFHRGKFKKVPLGSLYKFICSKIRTQLMLGLNKCQELLNKNSYCSLKEKLYHYIKYFYPDLFKFGQKILEYADDEYFCVIGIDFNGLIAATIFAIEKKIPVIYYNMELFLEQDCKTTQQKALKKMERECSQASIFTVIADERRAQPLIADNDLPPDKIVHVPISTIGKPYREKGDYLYRTLGIPKNKKILLSAGNIIYWSMSLELAQAAQKWGDDLVLVLHTWRPEARKEAYVRQIEKLTESGKVYLSLNPVEWETLPELLSSADIGLAFYSDTKFESQFCGHSSNKLAQYLQVGLPVITSDYPSFKEVIEGCKCGKCAGSPEEIERLAGEILQDYDTFCSNAIKCYQENYDLSKHFKIVVDKIKDLRRQENGAG